jgi:hypothetical protein
LPPPPPSSDPHPQLPRPFPELLPQDVQEEGRQGCQQEARLSQGGVFNTAHGALQGSQRPTEEEKKEEKKKKKKTLRFFFFFSPIFFFFVPLLV